jgi:ectoine hydroxylase-related dioxygenase (phytanoyl-CoA dioxygenase family)
MTLQEQFAEQGYVTGLRIMSPEEMTGYRREFDRIEAAQGSQASQVGIMNRHKEEPSFWALVSHPHILDAVEQILGPDILLLGSHFFCKYPNLSESYVAWHQDVTYWGLMPPKAISAWLALDDADVENGCMRVISGSHCSGLLPHGKADQAGNLLSVNQEIPAELVDSSKAVDLPLQAGMASIHDGTMVHGSNPNRSTRRRCGLTIRFTTPDVRPASQDTNFAKWKPILIRGQDRYGYFELDPLPDFKRSL